MKEIVMMDVKSIHPYEKNPRNNKAAVDKVAASLKEFGFRQPIVVDKDMIVVAGHTRLAAAKKLKLSEVPVLVADDLTDEQIKAYRLADNKTAEFAEWDSDLLSEELADILDIDMSEFGFELDIDDEDDGESEIEEDDAPDDVESRVKLGDVWQLGAHRLICGDSTDANVIDKLMDNKNAKLLLTDPPYGINADKGVGGYGSAGDKAKHYDDSWDAGAPDKAAFDLMRSVADTQVIFGGNYFTDKLPLGTSWIVWDKVGDIDFNNPFSDCELAWTNLDRVIVKKYTCIQQGFVAEEHEKRVHPTQKPVKLMAKLLTDYSDEGDIVLDVFGGSGSTLIACEQTSRRCFMCELSEHYCDVIIQRWETFTGQKAVLISGDEDMLAGEDSGVEMPELPFD